MHGFSRLRPGGFLSVLFWIWMIYNFYFLWYNFSCPLFHFISYHFCHVIIVKFVCYFFAYLFCYVFDYKDDLYIFEFYGKKTDTGKKQYKDIIDSISFKK